MERDYKVRAVPSSLSKVRRFRPAIAINITMFAETCLFLKCNINDGGNAADGKTKV